MFTDSIKEITDFLCAFQQGGNPLSDNDTSELYKILDKLHLYQSKIDQINEIEKMREFYKNKKLFEKLLKEHEEKEHEEKEHEEKKGR